MNRIDKMILSLQYFRREWIINKVKACSEQKEEELLLLTKKLLLQAQEKQREQRMGAAAYLVLFYFQSSLWTGSYRYRLVLADESLYLDTRQVNCDWVPRLIYNDAEKLKDGVEKELRKYFVRLETYEIEQVTRSILSEYHAFAELIWSRSMEQIVVSDEFKGVEKRQEFKILCGNYMGDLKFVTQSEKGS